MARLIRTPKKYCLCFAILLTLSALNISSAQQVAAPPIPIPKIPHSPNRLSFVDAPSMPNQPTGDPVEYAYSEKSSLALGRGFSPRDVTASPKAACITWTSEQLDPGPPSTDLNVSYVNTYEEMNFALGVDAKVDASYLGVSGGAHDKLDVSFLTKKNSITVVMRASTHFGRWGVKAGATLTDQAKAWLATSSKIFEERCGSRYVSVEGRGSSVSALITLEAVSNDVKTAFDSEMSASGGWGQLSAKASQIFHAEAKSASSQDRLQVQVFATGGTGFGGLAESIKGLMKTETGIEQATQALSTFLNQFNAANAAVLYYRVSSMEDFGWDPASIDPWTDLQERKLSTLAQEYRRISYDIDFSNGVVNGTNPLGLVLPVTAVDYIKKDFPRITEYQTSLAANHKACKLSSTANDASCDLPFNRLIPTVEGYFFILDPPRIVIHVDGLSAEQTKVVLNAAPELRLGYAKNFNSKIEGIGAMLQTPGYYELSLRVSFVEDKDGSESDIFVEGPWDDGKGAPWYHSSPAPAWQFWEDEFKNWVMRTAGAHSGTVIFTIKDKMHRTFRVAFMNAHWTSNGISVFEYGYELVY